LFKRRPSGEISRAAEVLLATLAERVGSGSVGLGVWDQEGSEKTGYTVDPDLLFTVAVERTESTGCTVSRMDDKPGIVFFEYGSAAAHINLEHDKESAFETGSPVVRIFSLLVQDVKKKERALEIAADLNASYPIIGTVELHEENDLIASASVPSRWLTANYLVELAITFVVWIDEIDTNIAQEVDGETADVDAPDNTHGRRMISSL
jgi:hypothetical protein